MFLLQGSQNSLIQLNAEVVCRTVPWCKAAGKFFYTLCTENENDYFATPLLQV